MDECYLRSIRAIYRSIRKARERQSLRFQLAVSDWINIAVLVTALVAIWVSLVALRHADQSGDLLISQLKSEEVDLDRSRALLDYSSSTLRDLLAQSQQQTQSSVSVVNQLDAQLKLNIAQTRLSMGQIILEKQQVETLQAEFGRRPDLKAEVSCDEPLRPGFPTWIKALQHHYSFDGSNSDSGHFELNIDTRQLTISCSLTVANAGTANAQGVYVDAELYGLHGLNQPFLPGRYPQEPQVNPPFAGIQIISSTGIRSSDKDGTLTLVRGEELTQARYGNGPIVIPFQISLEWEIDGFGLNLNVFGENVQSKSLSMFARVHRQGERWRDLP